MNDQKFPQKFDDFSLLDSLTVFLRDTADILTVTIFGTFLKLLSFNNLR